VCTRQSVSDGHPWLMASRARHRARGPRPRGCTSTTSGAGRADRRPRSTSAVVRKEDGDVRKREQGQRPDEPGAEDTGREERGPSGTGSSPKPCSWAVAASWRATPSWTAIGAPCLRPSGRTSCTGELLADRVAAILWRMRRSARVEAAAFACVSERPEHAPRRASRTPSPTERAVRAQFENDLSAPPCDCGAAARIEDDDGAERLFRDAAGHLDLLRSVVRSEAHLSRELARAWALLSAAQQVRGVRPALPPSPAPSLTDEVADADANDEHADGGDPAERT